MTAPAACSAALVFSLSLGAVVPDLAAQTPQPGAARARTQAAPTMAQGPAQPVLLTETPDARETRDRLRVILEQHPPSLAEVLRHDPTLLGNADYLAPYPQLAAFLAQHPEVARNPSFFIGDADRRGWEPDNPRMEAVRAWHDVLQTVSIAGVMAIVFSGIVWLIRTALDYRRWARLSKVQVDVHTKLLDRFTSNEDLLAYMQTPAGRKFLESAPISVDASPRAVGAPLSRILWSLQTGVVTAFLGLGMLFVSDRVLEEAEQPLFVLGVLALAVGAGFVVSAGISYALSRRLNLLPASQPAGDAAELRS